MTKSIIKPKIIVECDLAIQMRMFREAGIAAGKSKDECLKFLFNIEMFFVESSIGFDDDSQRNVMEGIEFLFSGFKFMTVRQQRNAAQIITGAILAKEYGGGNEALQDDFREIVNAVFANYPK